MTMRLSYSKITMGCFILINMALTKACQQKTLIWCPCWSHIRRKFVEAESGDPPFREWVLRQISYLFMFERVAWARSEEERLRIRAKGNTHY